MEARNFGSTLKMALAAALVALCLALVLILPSGAKAAESPYCGGWLGGLQSCWGAPRTLWGVQGWGEQHSVCVGTSAYVNTACSSGGGHYAYAPQPTQYVYPWIQNQGGGNNLVQGIAFQ
jgi:hypothetical protein